MRDHDQPVAGRPAMRDASGATPTYLASVPDEIRERIRLHLESRLTPTPDAPIALTARAWAVRGLTI